MRDENMERESSTPSVTLPLSGYGAAEINQYASLVHGLLKKGSKESKNASRHGDRVGMCPMPRLPAITRKRQARQDEMCMESNMKP
jgi:hypothetical protein